LIASSHHSLWQSFEEEIARYFSAWHLPSLKSEFEAFFDLSNEDQMMTTLGTLSVMLMICSLAVMVRASEKEIFGGLENKTLGASDDEDDLTCSRMQSELYCEHDRSQIKLCTNAALPTVSGAYQALRLCSFMSSPTISTITSEASSVHWSFSWSRDTDPNKSADHDGHLPAQLGTSFGCLARAGNRHPTSNCDGIAY
jgi:hypothetical protein